MAPANFRLWGITRVTYHLYGGAWDRSSAKGSPDFSRFLLAYTDQQRRKVIAQILNGRAGAKDHLSSAYFQQHPEQSRWTDVLGIYYLGCSSASRSR